MVAALPVAAVEVVEVVAAVTVVVAVVAVVAAATSVAARARRTPASHVKTLATAHQCQVNRVRHSRHAAAKIPNLHANVTSNSTRTRAVHAPNQEASRAMTSTTSNLPATPLQASRPLDNRQAATAATSVVDAPAAAAVRVAVVAGATGLVGRAVLARLLADKFTGHHYQSLRQRISVSCGRFRCSGGTSPRGAHRRCLGTLCCLPCCAKVCSLSFLQAF